MMCGTLPLPDPSVRLPPFFIYLSIIIFLFSYVILCHRPLSLSLLPCRRLESSTCRVLQMPDASVSVPEMSGSLPEGVSVPSVGGGVDVDVAVPSADVDASLPSASIDLPGELKSVSFVLFFPSCFFALFCYIHHFDQKYTR